VIVTVPNAVPAHIVKDLKDTMTRMRFAQTLNPKHEQPMDGRGWHVGGCEVCREQRRIDWLLEQIPKG
jgi:hypothetical protein